MKMEQSFYSKVKVSEMFSDYTKVKYLRNEKKVNLVKRTKDNKEFAMKEIDLS